MATVSFSDSHSLKPLNFLKFTYPEFCSVFKERTGKGEFFAKPLYRQVMQKGEFCPENLPCFHHSQKTLKAVRSCGFEIRLLSLFEVVKDGEVKKFVYCTEDKLKIEAVLIPMEGYKTLCISSQVGCKMGCVFCRTGKMKWVRNLETWEIVAQIYHVRHVLKEPVRNVVWMGMGEPLDNYENVFKAMEILTDPCGLEFKRMHLTLSTCGLADKIDRLAREGSRKCCLAVSLNAANDSLRNELMPVNKRYPLKRLKESLLAYPLPSSTVILFEYILIEGVNDTLKDAEEVIAFLKGLKARINLIPLNAPEKSPYKASGLEAREAFFNYLHSRGLRVVRRQSKGDQILAGCGQLGGVS